MSHWNQYGGDPAHSGYRPDLDGPMRVERGWSVDLNGTPSSPVLDRSAIYVGTDAGNLYAFDREDGHRRWVHDTVRGTTPTPVAAADHVFFLTDDATVTALEAFEGTVVWEASAIDLFEVAPRPAESDADEDGSILEGDSPTDEEPSLDRSAAKFLTSSSSTTSPSADDSTSTDDSSASNDRSMTGPNDRPTRGTESDTEPPAIAYDNATLVVATRRGVLALEAASGEPRWAYETGRPVPGVPAIDDEHVYVGTADGSILALEVQTGRTEWEAPTGGSVVGGPTLVDDRVYVADDDGTLLALDAETGQTYFTYEARTTFTSGPTVVDESVFVAGADGYLHVTDTTFGNRKLRGLLFSKKGVSLDGVADTDPVVAGTVLCIGDSSRRLYGIDALDPEFLWHHTLEAPVSATPALAERCLYVGLEDDTLWCLRGDPDAPRA